MATSPPPRRLADYAGSGDILVKLPHPYETAYRVVAVRTDTDDVYQLVPVDGTTSAPLPEPLHNSSLVFAEPQHLKSSDRPNGSNNTVWGRARRSPAVTIATTASSHAAPPTTAHLWLLIYAIITIQPSEEAFRLTLSIGSNSAALSQHLINLGLATPHPPTPDGGPSTPELLVLRSAFWQSAASPFGPRPIWTPESHAPLSLPPLSSYPPSPLSYTTTASSTFHPLRRAKPAPGSVVYSRWIPHLRETFSMVALDVSNPKHVDLFHTWQNDPRVSQGWDQSGSLDEHRGYLEEVQSDPHQLALLARFEGVEFAYFEAYWAKEDRIGAYYPAADFDRGRHSLVGDVRYRGPHRVSAWWSSLMHYLFLDEPRTMAVVGEPKFTNSSVLMYDLIHGFGLDKFVDLPHKRAALMRCSRERFFQLCPLDENDKFVGGTGVGLVPKL
ncbi:acyl-CoA N-acyltransferase [Podospora conica]|nr:acyl-CoA N-acyltransferase [Schizothecium conicum]